MDKQKTEVRVIHNHAPRVTLGPLGLYEYGQKLKVRVEICSACYRTLASPGCKGAGIGPDHHEEPMTSMLEVVVLNIDFDGAGVAWSTHYLNTLVDKRVAETGEDRKDAKAHVLKEKRRSRSAPHPAQYHSDVERIQAMMDRQAAVNRERYELV
jgi:hypothetical protein